MKSTPYRGAACVRPTKNLRIAECSLSSLTHSVGVSAYPRCGVIATGEMRVAFGELHLAPQRPTLRMSVLFYLAEQTRHERVFASVAASAQRPTDGFSCGCGPVKALGTMHSEPRGLTCPPTCPPTCLAPWPAGKPDSAQSRVAHRRVEPHSHVVVHGVTFARSRHPSTACRRAGMPASATSPCAELHGHELRSCSLLCVRHRSRHKGARCKT